MTILKLLESRLDDFTQAERKAAEYMISHPYEIHAYPLSDLAKCSGASNAAFIRVTQKLGFAGFSEFRFALRRDMLSPQTEPGDVDFVPKLLEAYVRGINKIPAFLDMDQQREIAQKIVSAKRLCLWGVSRTYLPALHLYSRLTRIGILCNATDDGVVMHDQAGILKEHDVCVLYTLLGRGGYDPERFRKIRENGTTVIIITMDPKLPLCKQADYVVALPCLSREDPTGFYEDQILVYLYNEILLALISQIIGDSGE